MLFMQDWINPFLKTFCETFEIFAWLFNSGLNSYNNNNNPFLGVYILAFAVLLKQLREKYQGKDPT